MDGVYPAGRGLRRPVVDVIVSSDGVTLRVDCDENDEYWFQVGIAREKLVDMLADCDMAHVEKCRRIAAS